MQENLQQEIGDLQIACTAVASRWQQEGLNLASETVPPFWKR